MTTIRSSGVEVTQQCKEIQEKIDLTSTKISSSMTSLNELINNKHNDTKLIAKVRLSIFFIQSNAKIANGLILVTVDSKSKDENLSD